jgi:hypothetical protein
VASNSRRAGTAVFGLKSGLELENVPIPNFVEPHIALPSTENNVMGKFEQAQIHRRPLPNFGDGGTSILPTRLQSILRRFSFSARQSITVDKATVESHGRRRYAVSGDGRICNDQDQESSILTKTLSEATRHSEGHYGPQRAPAPVPIPLCTAGTAAPKSPK